MDLNDNFFCVIMINLTPRIYTAMMHDLKCAFKAISKVVQHIFTLTTNNCSVLLFSAFDLIYSSRTVIIRWHVSLKKYGFPKLWFVVWSTAFIIFIEIALCATTSGNNAWNLTVLRIFIALKLNWKIRRSYTQYTQNLHYLCTYTLWLKIKVFVSWHGH